MHPAALVHGERWLVHAVIPLQNPLGERIETDPIGKLRRVRHVPYCQVRAQSRSDSAGVGEPERPRRLAGGAGKRFFRGQAK